MGTQAVFFLPARHPECHDNFAVFLLDQLLACHREVFDPGYRYPLNADTGMFLRVLRWQFYPYLLVKRWYRRHRPSSEHLAGGLHAVSAGQNLFPERMFGRGRVARISGAPIAPILPIRKIFPLRWSCPPAISIPIFLTVPRRSLSFIPSGRMIAVTVLEYPCRLSVFGKRESPHPLCSTPYCFGHFPVPCNPVIEPFLLNYQACFPECEEQWDCGSIRGFHECCRALFLYAARSR